MQQFGPYGVPIIPGIQLCFEGATVLGSGAYGRVRVDGILSSLAAHVAKGKSRQFDILMHASCSGHYGRL
jgi:hypothetical protein